MEEIKEEQKTAEQAEPPKAAPKSGEKKAKQTAAEKALAKALADLDAKEKELTEAKDKYLRMLAEYDNYRKRTQKEREGAYADGLADAVKEILPIIDNLERAAAVQDASKIAEGLALTLKQANAALSALKVEETAKAGDTFDPNLHNAVMHVEDENLGENVVAEVFQAGFMCGEKVIRFSMVKVAN